MKGIRISGLGVLCAFLVACQSTSTVDAMEKAVFDEITPDIRTELQQAIVQMIGGTAPRLADNVFLNSSELYIERLDARDAQDRPVLGRSQERVYRFELYQIDNQCILVHPGSSQRMTLQLAQCKPEKN